MKGIDTDLIDGSNKALHCGFVFRSGKYVVECRRSNDARHDAWPDDQSDSERMRVSESANTNLDHIQRVRILSLLISNQ